MRKLLTSLALYCFLSLSLCQWSAPILMKTDIADSYPALYISPTSGHKFVFYPQSDSTTSSLCYKVLDASDVVQTEICMKQTVLVKDICTAGTVNGQSIFVTFSARRSITSKNCTDTDVSGCSDIYFIESSNGGDSWTKPKAVPRRNMTDAANRKSPQVLYMEESKRLFIFYLVPAEDDHAIFQVTRPEGSLLFSNEAQVYRNSYPMTKLQVAYTNAYGESFVHIAFEQLYWMTLLVSRTNGATWLPAIPIRFVTPYFEYVMTPSSAGDVLFIVSKDRQYIEVMTIDFELNKEDFYIPFSDKPGYRPFVSPVPKENGMLVLTGMLENKPFSTYIYDNGLMKLKDLTFPAPLSPYADVGIKENDVDFKVTVLHNITSNLYLSTVTIPKAPSISCTVADDSNNAAAIDI